MSGAHAVTGDTPGTEWFAAPVEAWAAPRVRELRSRLAGLPGLGTSEQEVVTQAARAALRTTLQLRLNRVFLLELRAASLAGDLPGTGPDDRWDAFVQRACGPDFRDRLEHRYPGLTRRVAVIAALLTDAAVEFAHRLAADRPALSGLLGAPAGRLTELTLGAGDTHRGGRSVAHAVFEGGPVMYKPRPVHVDAALRRLLARVADQVIGGDTALPRVPAVLVRDGYGWAEYVDHRYCDDDGQLAAFYRNIGRWLAVMRLVGGTDLHAENIVAHGPEPVVVDAESLFAPDPAPSGPSGRGAAVDLAAATIRRTVLRTGILPVRMGGFALGGVDLSAAGSLPGQQPQVPMPVIVDGGTDTARMEVVLADLPTARNHPGPRPVLRLYWEEVLAGFREWTSALSALDARGGLERTLRGFRGCEVRHIRRATQNYVDIGRMLWHPASLHDSAAAHARAHDILARNAAAVPGAPTERAAIDSEIADLVAGDVPVFTHVVDDRTLTDALCDWRQGDFALEETTIQGALVGAYLNERSLPPRRPEPPADPSSADLERRRLEMARQVVSTLCRTAVRGDDGTATWISPVLTDTGWAIRPLTADVYTGQGGVALALAAYAREAGRGRAAPVPELEDVLAGTLRVLTATEDTTPTRTIGGFTGIASQVWTWTALYDLGWGDEALERARRRAATLTAESFEQDRFLDVLGGTAGVVVPLLGLAEATGEERWRSVAELAGRHLERTALCDARGARWSTAMFPEGIGGFAHGATGAGWALHRLALAEAGTAAERRRWAELADRALAFEDTLYDEREGNWRDARIGSDTPFLTAWCHGSTGIGLAAWDLYRRTGEARHLETARRAGAAALAEGFGYSHTLCHGDLGLWELLTALRNVDADPRWGDPVSIGGLLVSDLEQRGPVGGLAREAFSPGLMPGAGGVVQVLLRMREGHALPSPLLLERRPAAD